MPRKPVIFLISEDEATLKALEGLSERFTLERAENAYRALAQAKAADPHAIVLDEVVKDGDWRELYRSISQEFSYTFLPVLVLVEPEHAEGAIETLETGLVDVLVKPLRPVSLRARLKAMVQVKEMHDALDEERLSLLQKLDEERGLREDLARLNEELKKLSTTDALTGLANQRYLSDWLRTQFEVARRYDMPMAAIMLDLDNFKSVNDEHGHPFGNVVLKGIAEIILQQSRSADVAARYGGEEFAVILPNTGGGDAAYLAHRIHKAIEQAVFQEDGHSAKITASLGISAFPCPDVESSNDLIEMADRALYAAKNRGRNQVVAWNELD